MDAFSGGPAQNAMEVLRSCYEVDASGFSPEFLALLLALHEGGLTQFVRPLVALGQEHIDDLLRNTGCIWEANIMEIICMGSPYILPLAVRCGADINRALTQGLTPLAAAVFWGAADLVEELLYLGADVAPDAVYAAIRTNNRTMVDLLLGNGADANSAAGTRPRPLELALSSNHIQIAQMLLLHGADPRLCDPERVVEFPFEAFEWFVDCSGYSAGAQVEEHKSLIYLASREEYRQKIGLLLDRGAAPALMHEGHSNSAIFGTSPPNHVNPH